MELKMSEMQNKRNEQIQERHSLAVDRLRRLVTEETVPEWYRAYFQDTGIFLLELENVCEEQKVHKLMLEVRESNLDAISFYKDKGFTEDGLRKSYYSDPTEDAVLMSRELGR